MSDPKTLDVIDFTAAKAAISDIKSFGNGDLWALVSKASSESQGWMKSCKAMEVPGCGVCVQVTTQQRNGDGSYAVAEAVCFVPGARVDTIKDEAGKVIGRTVVADPLFRLSMTQVPA